MSLDLTFTNHPAVPTPWPSIPVEALDSIGIVGLVVLFAIALGTGWLYTRGQMRDVRHDRDEWRAESRIKDQQIAVKDEQLEHMGEVGRLAKDILHAMQHARDGTNR